MHLMQKKKCFQNNHLDTQSQATGTKTAQVHFTNRFI